ncbi:hypothetical protein [Methanothrix harundinacea]|uniref:Uncharacterized protein n=1 Tax=Methanothrix harundinacea (strain 6Ac) TaxID=1110509 RepID=G7WLK4_METH6|nr:hypothetical protein [Methanothrix harundinacea]AET64307.1 hypothetical protein Mhar_0936 [Methanothrix harundinacea 6Ac]
MGLILGFLLLLLASLANGAPEEEWSRTYGGPGHEVGGPISRAQDGGYVMTGMTESYGSGNGDLWLVKSDRNGSKLWDLTRGGGGVDVGESVIAARDGGYVVAGYTTSFGAGGRDVWLLKTDAEGNLEWERTFGGPGEEAAWSVEEAPSGGYVVVGWTDSYGIGKVDLWLIKTDPRGVEEWNRTIGGPGDDEGLAVVATRDGGYAIAGRTTSFGVGEEDGWLVKTDGLGAKEWARTFGGKGEDGLSSLRETEEGYVGAGYSNSFGSEGFEIWLVKADFQGVEVWNRTAGTPAADFGSSIEVASDGGYAVVGSTSRAGTRASPDDALLLKTDPEGRAEWSVLLGGDGIQSGISVLVAEEGGYIVGGFTNRGSGGGFDLWMTKLGEGRGRSGPIDRAGQDKGDSSATF